MDLTQVLGDESLDWPSDRVHSATYALGRAHEHRKAAARPSPSQPPGPARAGVVLRRPCRAISENEQAAGFIERARPFASNVHSADGDDGRDDGGRFSRWILPQPTHAAQEPRRRSAVFDRDSMTSDPARQLWESCPRPLNPLLLTSASQLMSPRYQVDTKQTSPGRGRRLSRYACARGVVRLRQNTAMFS